MSKNSENVALLQQSSDVVVYQSQDGLVKIDVRLEEDTVWLSQSQIVELFQSSKGNISEHITNIYQQGELLREATVRKNRTVQIEGNRTVTRQVDFYNLDMIISIGYRVNTKRGIAFRQWATSVLKDYMLRGYAINNRIAALEATVAQHSKQIDFFVRTALPPVEGIFYDGQIFDAYVFASDLIKRAQKRVVLIDNYVDESVLTLLDKRVQDVDATIYTAFISKQLQLDITKHDAEFAPITVKTFKQAHDRFLLIDDEVYHLGASLKDLGKKWFAFSRMTEITADELMQRVNV